MKQSSNAYACVDVPIGIEIHAEVSAVMNGILGQLDGASHNPEATLPQWRRFANRWLVGLCSSKCAGRALEEAEAEWQHGCARGGRMAVIAEAAVWCAWAAVAAMDGEDRAARERLDQVRRLGAGL